jgi:hypothetical protein
LGISRELVRQLERSAITTFWTEGAFHPGKTTAESLAEAADRADFAVFVLTDDDIELSRKPLLRVPALNVAFEAGFLAGRLGTSRIFLVVSHGGEAFVPTDLAGTIYIRLAARADSDLRATVSPAVAMINKVVATLGPRTDRQPQSYISYSWEDKDFAGQLHDDLQNVGVSCWLDAKEIKVGESIWEEISRAIEAHDKMLIVLSKASVASTWVNQEIKSGLRLERARKQTVLFPIRLDDAALDTQGSEEVNLLRKRLIIDFSGWQDRDLYQRAFSRLVRDLAISASVESARRG